MEYEERESEFDIEDEDKSEPEQTGGLSLECFLPSSPRAGRSCAGGAVLDTGVLVLQAQMLQRTKRSMSPPLTPSLLSAAGERIRRHSPLYPTRRH